VQDAITKARGRGRPSLSESGESPLLRVRIAPELDEAVTRPPRPLVNPAPNGSDARSRRRPAELAESADSREDPLNSGLEAAIAATVPALYIVSGRTRPSRLWLYSWL
jgi:hypothetical protein